MTIQKLTLSVPDDLYEKMGKYKERLNFSDVFRRAILAEIEKIDEKGLMVKELEVYIQQGQATPDDKEKIKKEEISRFTSKWGTPDYVNPIDLSEPPYVRLNKKQMVMDSKRLHLRFFLHINNDRNFAEKVHLMSNSKDNVELHDIITDYFKTKSFAILFKRLSIDEVTEYMTYGRAKDAKSIMQKMGPNCDVAFAADKDDVILIEVVQFSII